MKPVATVLAALAVLTPAAGKSEEPVTLANPAAVFCTEKGGTFEIRQDASGNQVGVCILADGEEVDAWTYFRENAPA